MSVYLKEKWTLTELLALPEGEHNFFERKGSKIVPDNFNDKGKVLKFTKDLGKVLSAFANSGGGHVILGQEDDCTITGVERIYSGRKQRGKQEFRAWLEKLIPNLLSYPLKEFRVHEIKSSALSKDRVLIVIDVGDSKLAPHQTNFKDEINIYYQRYGSHSVPAEHHNISLMFGRSRFPSKDVASSWIELVINQLLQHLKTESENLENKTRQWENNRRYYFLNSITPYGYLLNKKHSSICDLDILEQFFEFNLHIEKFLISHDEIVKNIERDFSKLYEMIVKTTFVRKYFRSITTAEKLAEIAALYSELKDIPPEALFMKFFNSKNEAENLDFITILMLNKHPKYRGDRTFDLFWEKEGRNFVALLGNPSLARIDKKIDQSYEHLHSTNQRIIDLLKKMRGQLSIEYGVPIK